MKLQNNAEHYINSSFGNLALFRGVHNTQNFKPHFHESYTVIFVDEGVGDYSTHKSNFVISKNTMLVLNPYEVHTGKPINNQPWSFLTLYIPVDVMKKVIGVENTNVIPFFKENKVENIELFKKGLSTYPLLLNKSDSAEEYLISFLKDLCTEYAYSDSVKKKVSERLVTANRIRNYIHKYYDDEISLNLLSKEYGISKYNLIKIFKDCYDLPPHQYAVNLKIEKAKDLLLKSYSCTEVAYKSGFFDQSHFIRHFKKIVGITPKRYLKQVI